MDLCIPFLKDCSVDWAATGSMLGGIAAFVATIYVVRAFNMWKKRATYSDRNKLAYEILAAYEMGRRTLKFIRYTLFSSDEVIPIIETLSKLEGDKHVERLKEKVLFRKVIRDRIKENRDVWKEVEKLLPKAKASFGDDVRNMLERLLLVVNDSDSLAHADNIRLFEFHLKYDPVRIFPDEEEEDKLIKEDGIYQAVVSGYTDLEAALKKQL